MRIAVTTLALTLALAALARPAFADKVTLRTDEVIEGDVALDGEEVVVTMRSGVVVRVLRSDVRSIEKPGDKPVTTPAPKGVDVEDLFRDAVKGKDDAAKRLLRAPRVAKPLFTRKLEQGGLDERLLAASLLGRLGGDDAAKRLAGAALEDDAGPVRTAAVAALTSLAHPQTTSVFAKALARPRTNERIRAALALRVFPGAAAIPALLDTSTIKDTGRHRVHIYVGTERAYLADWELSTGGSGLIVAEVAKPTTGAFADGVCLEVDAKYVTDYEWRARSGTLRTITGESFDTPEEWRRWRDRRSR